MLSKKIIAIIGLFVFFNAASQTTTTFNLMPVPKEITIDAGSFSLTKNFSVSIHTHSADTILVNAVNRMYQTLNRRSGLYFLTKRITSNDKSDSAALQVTVSKSVLPAVGLDESYQLKITNNRIMLNAPTTLGALHGLETILQLLNRNDDGTFYFPAVSINDAPRCSWRGLMIDVSRHFIPVDVLERNIEAMAAVKMNVLHLHLSDNDGFRIESKVFPQLQIKGSNGDYYTQAQMKDLIAFAQARGIIIVPEFDMPGHTKSWFAGYPQLASAPGPYEPGPPIDLQTVKLENAVSAIQVMNTAPFPAIDPTKESTYDFIDKFFGEMSALFPSPYIHIGADENNGVVWKNNPAIVAFMKAHKIPDTHALQEYFVERVKQIVVKHHKKMIGWEEAFSKTIGKDVIIQVWKPGSSPKLPLDNGNKVLISTGFYLDLFMPAYIHYNNPGFPAHLPDSVAQLLLGGEAAQWTEIADKTNIETRIWPRAAAIAERLWSPAAVNNVDDMYRRLFALSLQLDDIGVQNIADYERGLRRISGYEFDAVKTLTDVLAPIKGYKKLFGQIMKPKETHYQTSPLIQVSDIIPVDSKVKWQFRMAVKSYLSNKDTASENLIRNYLMRWQNNSSQLKNLFTVSSELKAVEEHSKNLSVIASVGLDALNRIKSGSAPDAAWISESMETLKAANKVYGETEICIIPEIESLVKQQLEPLPKTYPVF